MTVTVTDLFCGAGGSSLGAEIAGATLQLGLNHWSRAIETHAANFQHADHDCADVSQTDPRRYRTTDILLASPECTNHSLAKGARRRKPQAASLWEDGPSGDAEQDRSRATMWDVVRFAEAHAYKAIVVENVVDAFKWGPSDDGALFDAWLTAMQALGYRHRIVWLNSMFAGPVPQSRDRMYVVFLRQGIREPDLRVTPPAWCPSCAEVVPGQQAWKPKVAHRPWGRYGPQYIYRCPVCNDVVLPGAFPAASAIDWSLDAAVIGDRARPLAAATRARIQRGLERLASEPFAIRLLQGGAPRPLTLPLVTLTRRHDVGVVLPVAGNTYETTPGNRARLADTTPMPTVHGTADQALVLANRANNVPRLAASEPTHPVLTGSHMGVVEFRRNGDVRDAETEPAHTLCTSGAHHGVVMANFNPGWARHAGAEPFGSVTTRDHHSLVVPYYSNGTAVPAGREPVPTVPTKDRMGLVVPRGDTMPPLQTEWGDSDIDACRFRMFALHEIAATMAMRYHVDGGIYVVTGNKREQMAQYGNAVTPPAMTLLVSRLLEVVA